MWFSFAMKKISSKPGPAGETAFIAFHLPENVYKRMKHIEDLDDFLHMTLVFVPNGVKEQKDRDSILKAVEEVASKFSPLKCKFTEIGLMDNGENTLVANVNVENGAEIYSSLIESINNHWHEFERRYNFLPHVTLRYINQEDEAKIDELRRYSWTADEIIVQFKTGGKKHKFKLKGKKSRS